MKGDDLTTRQEEPLSSPETNLPGPAPDSAPQKPLGDGAESIGTALTRAYDRLDQIICAADPIAVFGLYSGGHDSFTSTYVASAHPRFTAAVHVNTGFGIEATREHVRETCEARRWPLLEYKASENVNAKGEPDPKSYEWYALRFGFPGPGGHQLIYNHLKERQLRRLERDFGAVGGKRPRRVLYVNGCRSQESERRMANTQESQIDGRRAWAAVIHDFSALQTRETLAEARQEPNPVTQLIHKSGECMCGAFAQQGELEELNCWDLTRPMYNRIKALEQEIVPRFGRGWGERPIDDNLTIVNPGMLCWGCDKVNRSRLAKGDV